MNSGSSVRLWRVYREAGRPWPVISDDDVLDFMIMEAVALKAKKEERELREEAELEAKRKEFKENYGDLESYR